MLKQNAALLLTTPNSGNIFYLVKYIKGYSPTELQNPGHIRFFTYKSIKDLLIKQGFIIHSIYPVPLPRKLRTFYSIIEKFHFKSKFQILEPWLGANLVVVARKVGKPRYDSLFQVKHEFHQEIEMKRLLRSKGAKGSTHN